MPRLDPVLRRGCRKRGGDLGLGDEQMVLEAEQELTDLRGAVGEERLREPEVGAQLVERAERLDPSGVLQYAGATRETGLAAVTGAGV